jgi:peptide-methionine (S)-S-oxide reductase
MNPSPDSSYIEIATMGGGCFWCLEPVFAELQGVLDVVVGYAGGSLPDPSYRQVCDGNTGHAEVVQVTFDPSLIPYRDLLEVFFSVHDPTTPNRQGNDVGPQYRSIILYHSEQQKEAALELIRELERAGAWNAPLVTQVEEFKVFYPAEDYHQEYFKKNPWQGYCQVIIKPKVAKFQQKYRERLKA